MLVRAKRVPRPSKRRENDGNALKLKLEAKAAREKAEKEAEEEKAKYESEKVKQGGGVDPQGDIGTVKGLLLRKRRRRMTSLY